MPCEPWDVRWCADCDLSTTSAVVTGFAVEAATEILWALTGRQFGLCTISNLRPCRRECPELVAYNAYPSWPMTGWTYPQPWLEGGQWFNLTCGQCGGDCSCTSISEFVLPGPVHDIIEIKIDGTVLPTGSYRLDNQRIVVRIDGGTWPLCNDLSLNDGVGTWIVSAHFGNEPPALADLAIGELAYEIIKACTNQSGCRLPTRMMTSLARQGVSMTFPDPASLTEAGLLGLDFCDFLIRSFNPSHLPMASGIFSPDEPPMRRVST